MDPYLTFSFGGKEVWKKEELIIVIIVQATVLRKPLMISFKCKVSHLQKTLVAHFICTQQLPLMKIPKENVLNITQRIYLHQATVQSMACWMHQHPNKTSIHSYPCSLRKQCIYFYASNDYPQ